MVVFSFPVLILSYDNVRTSLHNGQRGYHSQIYLIFNCGSVLWFFLNFCYMILWYFIFNLWIMIFWKKLKYFLICLETASILLSFVDFIYQRVFMSGMHMDNWCSVGWHRITPSYKFLFYENPCPVFILEETIDPLLLSDSPEFNSIEV